MINHKRSGTRLPKAYSNLVTAALIACLLNAAPVLAQDAGGDTGSVLEELPTAPQSPPDPQPINPVAFVEIPRASGLSASDDGRFVSYLVATTDWEENERRDRLYVRQCSTSTCVDAPTPGIGGEPKSEAIWRPGGVNEFLILLDDKKTKNQQVNLYDMTSRELRQLTRHHDDVEDLEWLPDGSGFLFSSDTLQDNELSRKWRIEAFGSSASDTIYRHDLASGETDPIFPGAGVIEGFSIAADGASIIVRQRGLENPEDRNAAELWLVDLADGKSERLTNNRYREIAPQLSPDNTRFAYIATVNEDGEAYYEDNLFVHIIGEDKPRLLIPDEPLEVLEFRWDASSEGLWLLGNSGLRTQLYFVTLETGKLRAVTEGDHAIRDWHFDSRTSGHFLQIASASSPGDIVGLKDDGETMQPIVDLYADWSERFRLPDQEAFAWRGEDGQALEGLLVYPVGYKQGEAYPLVTITHGGPRSSAQFGSWSTSRYVSVLAGQGYAVFLPNHRGGTGYGDEFMRDMVGNYFRNAHKDVLTGIDALIAAGVADPDRLIKMGWSAGGHMTNKLVTLTPRFRAASSGAGVADWVSLYGESDRRAGRTPWFGGTPWERDAPIRSYRSQSPIFDAWRVTTPTLFWNGGNDRRVPPTQAIMIHRAVRDTGTPTALYLGRNEPHNFRRPSNILFKINRELAWYAEHLGRDEYVPDLPDIAFAQPEMDEESETEEAADQ